MSATATLPAPQQQQQQQTQPAPQPPAVQVQVSHRETRPEPPPLPVVTVQLTGYRSSNETPSKQWDTAALTEYALNHYSATISISRAMAEAVYRAGHAISLIETKLSRTDGGIKKWCKDQGLSRATVYRYRDFYLSSKGKEKLIEGLPYDEARKR